jgi:hypothetical protein
MVEAAALEQVINTGVIGMLFFMLGVLWKGYTTNNDARIEHLEEQNKILLTQVVQQNFRASPAVAPIPPSWGAHAPTSLERELEG